MPTAITIRPDPGSRASRMVRDHVYQRRKLRTTALMRAIEEVGHTITTLARATAVDRSYISRIVSGHRTPGLDTTYRLGKVLGKDMEWMTRTLLPDLDVIDHILRTQPTIDPNRKPTPKPVRPQPPPPKHWTRPTPKFAIRTHPDKPTHGTANRPSSSSGQFKPGNPYRWKGKSA